jgi:hypothetical protein
LGIIGGIEKGRENLDVRVFGIVASFGHDEPGHVLGIIMRQPPGSQAEGFDGGGVGWIKICLKMFRAEIRPLLVFLFRIFSWGHQIWCDEACRAKLRKAQQEGREKRTFPNGVFFEGRRGGVGAS